MSQNPIQWRRIYRQTMILIYKNLLILYKAPVSTAIRALIFPIAVTLIFSELVHIDPGAYGYSGFSSDGSIAPSSSPVKDLSVAMRAGPSQRLVFVRNGTSDDLLPILNTIIADPDNDGLDILIAGDTNDLFDLCKQSILGVSDCFAAVVFSSFNESNVDYTIVLGGSLFDVGTDVARDETLLATTIFPLQWAIDSHVGNFSRLPKPSEQAWDGDFYVDDFYEENSDASSTSNAYGPIWLGFVADFVGPLFFLILIGVVYHLSIFVATERQSSISELMEAQKVTYTPRILSNILSFLVVYFPGYIICSVILTQILFTHTSDILLIFLTILAGMSVTVSSHFLASFFGKAQLAGLYTSTLAFALALVTLASKFSAPLPGQNLALAFVFPPMTWVTLIEDIAQRELNLKAFSLSPQPTLPTNQFGFQENSLQILDGYLYIVFFIVQIIVYGVATFVVERQLWGIKRDFDRIDSSSDVALRCTSLSKTYYGKRPWYWPFKVKGSTVVAVDHLDLEVKKGSVTFLLGPNGGGKTTTLKCIAGMTTMDTGSRLELNEAGLVFGICPQQNVFWDTLTVKEHIRIWRKLKTAAFDDLNPDDEDVLQECDLLEKIDARAKTLSGGQMRKLQLAISFVGGSKVCCIDEASSGLDPLSRRNIWNIIQKGHSRRTVLVTTHFLDEADVLADHIAIVYKGKLVCEGAGPSLKARYGDDYVIRVASGTDSDAIVWRTSNSAEATKKILELESLTEDHSYNVVFPTLEQVFLKVTSDSNTAVHEGFGDGIVGEEAADTVIEEKIFALETQQARDIDLDVGHSVGIAKQIMALFHKRYMLLLQKSGWISYGINLIIPIIIAAALVKPLHTFAPLETCEMNVEILRLGDLFTTEDDIYNFQPLFVCDDESYCAPSALLGPSSAFSGTIQDQLYIETIARLVSSYSTYNLNSTAQNQVALNSRAFVEDTDGLIAGITNSSWSFQGIGIFAPTPETATLFYLDSKYDIPRYTGAFSLITNRIANATTNTGTARASSVAVNYFSHAISTSNFYSMPIAILIALAFITASSISVIYPAFEKINCVRALHYCNGVSPFALWFAYLVFDTQFIIIQSIIVWCVLYSGPLAGLYYAGSYMFGVFILFGIATYLGTYVISLFVKRAAFAIAAAIHMFLFACYVAAYVMDQQFGNINTRPQIYSLLQYGLGLSSPSANLIRGLFLSMNVFEIVCGKYGDADVSNGFAYVRYGGIYANLLIQIVFLMSIIAIYEYGSADWLRRNITHRGVPARLHYIVDSGTTTVESTVGVTEKTSSATTDSRILNVSHVSKFFGKIFAAENISFEISSNETLALLGGNGAGKTTMINMIRGELRPDFGDIRLDGVSVLKQPHKVRSYMGVCPQDDAVDNLTVRQTLSFYATVKGLKNVSANVDKVLATLNITIYENVIVKALSGGTKRKLSVAIALLGNPRILLLDEPSTGQDAGAKRILWKTLQDISANRAILLTTHSMEEAEALATNVAIMGTRMLATGTLTSLQEAHGGAFSIRAVRTPETTREEVEQIIWERFEGRVSGYEDSHGQVSFKLPHEKRALGAIMRIMEELKGDPMVDEHEVGVAVAGSVAQEAVRRRMLQDYTVNGPTLEEVFMNVARESGVSGAGGV